MFANIDNQVTCGYLENSPIKVVLPVDPLLLSKLRHCGKTDVLVCVNQLPDCRVWGWSREP